MSTTERELQILREELAAAERELRRQIERGSESASSREAERVARFAGENDPESINARLRRLQGDLTAAEDTISTQSGELAALGGAVDDLLLGATAAAGLEVRTLGGTAEVEGFEAFATPETPPKKHRTKTLSGAVTTQVYTDSGGTTPLTVPPPDESFGPYAPPSAKSSVAVTVVSGNVDIIKTPLGPNTYFAGAFFFKDGSTTPFNGWEYNGAQPTAAGSYEAVVWRSTNGNYPAFGATEATYTLYHLGWFFVLGAQPVQESLTYSGTSTIDDVGAQTDAGEVAGELFDTGADELAAESDTGLAGVNDAKTRLGGTHFTTDSNTRTVHSLVGTATVVSISGSGTRYRKVISTTAKDTLSAEDTEAAAIGRLEAAASWTAWGATSTSVVAEYGARTSTFTFVWAKGEWRAVETGLSASTLYQCSAYFYKRAQGSSDAWTLHSNATNQQTTDGSGNATFSGDFPTPVRGFEIYVAKGMLRPL